MAREHYFNFDRGAVDALDKAIEASRLGDVPDLTLGIISSLKMNGYDVVKSRRPTAPDGKGDAG